MSSHIYFTPFHPVKPESISPDRKAHGTGVKIHDVDALKSALSTNMEQQMDTGTFTDRSEYPGKEWKKIYGFTTYGGVEIDSGADYHNVSNTSVDDLAELFGTVSEYTDAFVVWTTNFSGGWPHAAELHDSDEEIFQITAEDGDVEITEITVGVVESTTR